MLPLGEESDVSDLPKFHFLLHHLTSFLYHLLFQSLSTAFPLFFRSLHPIDCFDKVGIYHVHHACLGISGAHLELNWEHEHQPVSNFVPKLPKLPIDWY